MENKNLLKNNSFKIVGILRDTDVTSKVSARTGKTFASGEINVVSKINNVENIFTIKLLAMEKTQEGATSKLYESYLKLNTLVGKKIEVNGSFAENRFYSVNNSQLVSRQELNGRFIRGVVDSTEDCATFEIGGFIAKSLTEKKNKKDEVYRYDLSIAQANYNEDNLSIFTLHVNPDNREVVNGINNYYQLGDTVLFTGNLVFTEETVVVESENTAFGAPSVRQYVNKQYNYYITGGSNPYTDNAAYSDEVKSALLAAYKANDVKIEAEAKERNAGKANTQPASATTSVGVTKRQTSLL